MSDPSPTTLPKNTSGALIFTAYVLSALFLTIFITRSLLIVYHSKPPTPSVKNRIAARKTSSSFTTRLITFTCLSILSFSVLSYNMLSFLIVSYTTWANNRHMALPDGLLGSGGALFGILRGVTGNGGMRVEVWEWLTTSTLFQDFARDICDDWARYTWTCLTLVGTMVVGMWMGREGMSILFPPLILEQLFPISFPQQSLHAPTPCPKISFTTSPRAARRHIASSRRNV